MLVNFNMDNLFAKHTHDYQVAKCIEKLSSSQEEGTQVAGPEVPDLKRYRWTYHS